MDGDGGQLSQITEFSSAIPDWFPSGDRLIFNSDSRLEPNDTPDLYAMNLDGSDLVEIIDVDEVADFAGHVSPDGSQVVFNSTRSGVAHVYVADIDGGNLIQLTEGEQSRLGSDISPDGAWILYYAYSAGDQVDLYKMRLDGSEKTQLTDLPGAKYDGAWSPDGERITFVYVQQQFPVLYLMNADGSNLVQISPEGMAIISPSWH